MLKVLCLLLFIYIDTINFIVYFNKNVSTNKIYVLHQIYHDNIPTNTRLLL